MKVYALYQGWVQAEIDGIQINGKNYSASQILTLEADNAAKDARIKQLEADVKREAQSSTNNAQDCLDEQLRAEALEAKIEAAEKALEPFADHANERAVDDTGWRDKETVKIVVSIGDLRKARAVLGGKP